MRSSQFYGNKNNTCFFLSNFYYSFRKEKEPSGRPGSFRKESLFLFIHSKIEIMDFRSIIFGLFSNLDVDSNSIRILIEDSS